jgi:hypothetical protein
MLWTPDAGAAPFCEELHDMEHGDQLPAWHVSTTQGGVVGQLKVCVEQTGCCAGIPIASFGALEVQKQQSTCDEIPASVELETVLMQTQVLDLVPAWLAETPHVCAGAMHCVSEHLVWNDSQGHWVGAVYVLKAPVPLVNKVDPPVL